MSRKAAKNLEKQSVECYFEILRLPLRLAALAQCPLRVTYLFSILGIPKIVQDRDNKKTINRGFPSGVEDKHEE